MGLFRPSLVSRRSDGTYIQRFPEHLVHFVLDLGRELSGLLDSDDPDLRRLFPTAYPDDPERDAGYQILARSELIEARRESLATLERTADTEVLTEEELSAWMAVVNDIRLVLGTKLDVGEDDDLPDPDDPDAHPHQVYLMLGMMLGEIVEALASALPEEGTAPEATATDDDLDDDEPGRRPDC